MLKPISDPNILKPEPAEKIGYQVGMAAYTEGKDPQILPPPNLDEISEAPPKGAAAETAPTPTAIQVEGMEKKASNLLKQATQMQWYLNPYYKGGRTSLDPDKQTEAIEEKMKAYLKAEEEARKAREALEAAQKKSASAPL